MSEIGEEYAKELIGDGDLYAPNEDERYANKTVENLKRSRPEKPASTTDETPPSDQPRLHPMSPEDRLAPGESILIFPGPKPPGSSAGAGHDADPAGRDPAPPRHLAGETEQTTTAQPTYAWHKHWDFGLLRERPPGGLYFDAWCPPNEHDKGLWHHVTFNPFTASMGQIDEAVAKRIIGDGDLYAPNEDAEYRRRAKINMARVH